jgi:hypothetical protein
MMASAAPAVVRVLATTCAGTGEGTGTLIEGDKILTAASAIKEPMAIVIVTPDNRIRRANLFGTSADGVAVLRMIGPLDAPRLRLAATELPPNAERALIGYTAAGAETIQKIGTAAHPVHLSTVMDAAKLGGPVLGTSGQVVGMVVGDTVQASTIVGVDKLRAYVAPGSTGIKATLGDCPRSRGPQTPVAPELQVASTPLAVEVQQLLTSFYTHMNRHEFEAVQPLYSRRLARSLTPDHDRRAHQTSYFFLPKVTELTRFDGDGAAARVSLNVLFAPGVKGSGGQSCNRLDYRYEMVRRQGKLVIDRAVKMSDPQPCESE